MNAPIDHAKQAHINLGIGEARIRQDEGRSNIPANRPLPEGRMRIQETSRYSTNIEANIQKPKASTAFNPPKQKQEISISKQIIKESTNPFGDEDEDGYDKSKNPFAEDEDDENGAKVQSEVKNPFEEYDNNLNPFAE